MKEYRFSLLLGLVSIGLAGISPHASSAQYARRVDQNVIVSDSLPAIRVVVAPNFEFLGNHPFRIRDVAAGHRYVFAELNGGVVQRMVVAQFEGFLPESSEKYNYSFRNAEEVAGLLWRSNGFYFSHKDAARQNPLGEAALTAAFVTEQGLDMVDSVVVYRFLAVPDIERRHELILFYIEPLEPGMEFDDFERNGAPTPEWVRLVERLRESASNVISRLGR